MNRKQLEPYMDKLARKYLTENNVMAFDEYLDAVCDCCPNERCLIDFLRSNSSLQDLPGSLHRLWQELSCSDFRKAIMFEAMLLLLKAKAENGEKGYSEARGAAAAMMGILARKPGSTVKRRNRIIDSYFTASQKFRSSFIRHVIAIKGTAILRELAIYYSAIDGVTITSEQLLQEAEKD